LKVGTRYAGSELISAGRSLHQPTLYEKEWKVCLLREKSPAEGTLLLVLRRSKATDLVSFSPI